MTRPTKQEAVDLTSLIFSTAIGKALVRKGILTKQELKDSIVSLCPKTVMGQIMQNDLLAPIDRWQDS